MGDMGPAVFLQSWVRNGDPMRFIWSAMAVVLLSCGGALPVVAQDAGWVLTQKSASLGDQYVYISPNGMKCVNPRIGFAIVTHAPDWRLVMYNEKTKVFYQTTIDRWRQEMDERGLHGQLQGSKWKKGARGQVGDLKATQYLMVGAPELGRLPNGKLRKSKVTGAEYWISDDIQVPSRLSELLSTAYGLPATQSVPLRLSVAEKDGNKNLLNTYRMQKTGIPVSYFECPQGFTQVQTDAEVMMTDEQRQLVDDMAKQLGDSGPETVSSAAAAPPADVSGSSQSSAGSRVTKNDLAKLLECFRKR